MDEIMDLTDQLLKCIQESDIYHEFRTQEELLLQDPEKYSLVDRFRRENYRSLSDQSPGNKEKAQRLREESDFLRKDPQVDAYLNAELSLCAMMQKICRKLMEGIEFRIPEDL